MRACLCVPVTFLSLPGSVKRRQICAKYLIGPFLFIDQLLSTLAVVLLIALQVAIYHQFTTNLPPIRHRFPIAISYLPLIYHRSFHLS